MRLFCYVLLSISLLTVSATSAQNARSSVGLRAGIGLAGSGRFDQLDREVSDQYKRGRALSGGVQFRYRLNNQASLTAGADWQRMHDGRSRVFTPVEQFTSDYKNQLTRLQVPVGLQLRPVSKWKAFYISAGAGPVFSLHGSTKFTTFSSRVGELPGGSLDIPLDLPANRHLRMDWVLVGSAGVSITKKLALELVYQHAKPLAYATFDPGNTQVNPPVYSTRAGQGWLLTTIYWIR